MRRNILPPWQHDKAIGQAPYEMIKNIGGKILHKPDMVGRRTIDHDKVVQFSGEYLMELIVESN
jgi:hypothetical protein